MGNLSSHRVQVVTGVFLAAIGVVADRVKAEGGT